MSLSMSVSMSLYFLTRTKALWSLFQSLNLLLQLCIMYYHVSHTSFSLSLPSYFTAFPSPFLILIKTTTRSIHTCNCTHLQGHIPDSFPPLKFQCFPLSRSPAVCSGFINTNFIVDIFLSSVTLADLIPLLYEWKRSQKSYNMYIFKPVRDYENNILQKPI